VTAQPLPRVAKAIAAAGLDWLVPDWPASDVVEAFSTTRAGGVSSGRHATLNLAAQGDDDEAAVAENRRRVQSYLPSPPVWLQQVHGRDVLRLDATTAIAARVDPQVADAAVTATPGVVLAIRTADCLPVLFADRDGRAVGAAHAGWRGLAGGVLEATVAALGDCGVPAGRLCAWIGPGIGPEAFEVGGDVRAAFCATDAGADAMFTTSADGKWRADLPSLARRRLAACGVADVGGGTLCTWTDGTRFYSFRRDGNTGRHATFVWLRPSVPGERV
jgi:YfiH family protein